MEPLCHETTQRTLGCMVSDTGSHTWTRVEDTQTYLDPRDVQVQGTGHQEADRKYQQQQDSHAPRDREHRGHCELYQVSTSEVGLSSWPPCLEPQEEALPISTCHRSLDNYFTWFLPPEVT